MSKDQRACPRVNVNWSAACALVDPVTPPWPVRVANVSESGVGLLSARNVPAGRVVDLRTVMPPRAGDPDSHTLRLRGKVVHAVFRKDEFLLGIQILNISEADKTLLQRWIARPLMEARELQGTKPG